MLRKWQYIAKRCREVNYRYAAHIAQCIDDLMVHLEYREYTEVWIRDYDNLDSMTISRISSHGSYCPACMPSEGKYGDCSDCKFSVMGGCDLFINFRDLMDDYDE